MIRKSTESIFEPGIPGPSIAAMLGVKFGRLLIVSYAGRRKGTGYVNCKCDCGKEVISNAGHIRASRSKSCGCLISELTTQRLTIHGYAPLHGKRKKSYTTWQSMMRRCYNPHDNHFYLYGGRGINVCDRWHDFQNFLADMGDPDTGMSIERADNNKNYCPENCSWIPRSDQAKNRRYNWTVSLDGQTMTVAEAARRLGMNKTLMACRLRRMNYAKDSRVDAREAMKTRKKTSQFTGVCFDRFRNKWSASITINGNTKHIGRFATEQEAADCVEQNKLALV